MNRWKPPDGGRIAMHTLKVLLKGCSNVFEVAQKAVKRSVDGSVNN